jgi:hypothetical protein
VDPSRPKSLTERALLSRPAGLLSEWKMVSNFYFLCSLGGKQVRRLLMMNIDLIVAVEGTRGQWCENRYFIQPLLCEKKTLSRVALPLLPNGCGMLRLLRHDRQLQSAFLSACSLRPRSTAANRAAPSDASRAAPSATARQSSTARPSSSERADSSSPTCCCSRSDTSPPSRSLPSECDSCPSSASTRAVDEAPLRAPPPEDQPQLSA